MANTSNINVVVARFDPDYILNKLYDFDEELGGNLRMQAEEEARQDPFNLKVKEIKQLFMEVKKDQAGRNKIRLNEGRNYNMLTLQTKIDEQLHRAEKEIEDADRILRQQTREEKFDKENLTKKREAFEGLKSMLKQFKEKEIESKKIKSVKDIAKETGVDIRMIDMSKVGKAEQRNLSSEEKAFLERVKAENEELDQIMKEADRGMDILLRGIDEIEENLDTQKNQIKRLDKKTSKLEGNLDRSNKKLKATVGKFRSATNVAMDIVLIVILLIMIGVLIKVLSAKN